MTVEPAMESAAPYSEKVAGFIHFLRQNDMQPGTGAVLGALAVANQGMLTHRRGLFYGLRALLCGNREDFLRFEGLFDAYWSGERRIDRERPKPKIPKEHWHEVRALYLGLGSDKPAEDEGSETTGAAAVEKLAQVDLAKAPQHQTEELEALAQRLARRLAQRVSRRFKASKIKDRPDLRRTIRKGVASGGDLIHLCYKGRRQRRPRLVFFLDCSGSMDQYSLFFLRFIYAMRRHYPRVDAFLFSTRLTRISGALANADMDDALTAVSNAALSWSSGTRIAHCLEDFVKIHGRDMLTRRTHVFILSDGLDTDTPNQLTAALAAVKRRAKRLIWLNPLAGSKDYRPEARAMAAAMPFVDHFLPAHNLESLAALEHLLVE